MARIQPELEEILDKVKDALVKAHGKDKTKLKKSDFLRTTLALSENNIKKLVKEIEKTYRITLLVREVAEADTLSDLSKVTYSQIT